MNLTDWSGPALILTSLGCAAISAAGCIALAWLATDDRPIEPPRSHVRLVDGESE